MLQQLLTPVVTKAIINVGILRRLCEGRMHFEQAASEVEVNKAKWSYMELDVIQGR